ncbi:unnamed protein product, partial [Laminaria digitata]
LVPGVSFDDPCWSVLTYCIQMQVLEFTGYGASGIKTFKVSPDAFVQMALQLAIFKMTG